MCLFDLRGYFSCIPPPVHSFLAPRIEAPIPLLQEVFPLDTTVLEGEFRNRMDGRVQRRLWARKIRGIRGFLTPFMLTCPTRNLYLKAGLCSRFKFIRTKHPIPTLLFPLAQHLCQLTLNIRTNHYHNAFCYHHSIRCIWRFHSAQECHFGDSLPRWMSRGQYLLVHSSRSH
jgi:hypothetical protein